VTFISHFTQSQYLYSLTRFTRITGSNLIFINCGQDLKQKINGKIIYVPYIKDPKTFRYNMEMDTPNG